MDDKLINGSTKHETKQVLNRKIVSNYLTDDLDNKISTSKLELFKINKVIENAIHWCLVNGKIVLVFKYYSNYLMLGLIWYLV